MICAAAQATEVKPQPRILKFHKPKGGLPHARLLELLHYNQETGVFTWRKTRGPRAAVGQQAGCADAEGYIVIRVDMRIYKAHRLAWFYVTGQWPNGLTDHRNGVTGDNHWANLRLVDHQGNAQNRKRPANNKSGWVGVTYLKRCGKWQAVISGRYLGRFHSAEAAGAAYLAAKARIHLIQPIPRS